MDVKHIRNFIKSNNHTNIILVSVPHRYDLMESSCLDNEIRSFNRKLMISVRAYQHESILEMSSDRKLFTNHGLHLNGLGKEVLSKQIVSHTYAMLDQKKNPPVILSFNSDLSHTDTLHHGRVNRTSTRIKKTPINEIQRFFMVNADLNMGGDINITQSRQGGGGKTHITIK